MVFHWLRRQTEEHWETDDISGSSNLLTAEEHFNVQEVLEGEKSISDAFSWTGLTWGRDCKGGQALWSKNRQMMLGSRWGAALSTGAAQMPLKQSEPRLSRDTGTCWSLLIQSHPQPSHLLSRSLGVIKHGTGWACDRHSKKNKDSYLTFDYFLFLRWLHVR